MIELFDHRWMKDIANLHTDGISTGFISTLGMPFVATLYRAISQSPYSVTIVDTEGDKVNGFIAGTVSTRAMYRWVFLRYGLLFFLQLGRNIVYPRRIKKIFETIMYAHNSEVTSKKTERNDLQAELLSIVVAESMRGKGVGRLLVLKLEEFYRENGIIAYKVATRASDQGSNSFYIACNFVKTRSFFHHGIAMNEYKKRII